MVTPILVPAATPTEEEDEEEDKEKEDSTPKMINASRNTPKTSPTIPPINPITKPNKTRMITITKSILIGEAYSLYKKLHIRLDMILKRFSYIFDLTLRLMMINEGHEGSNDHKEELLE